MVDKRLNKVKHFLRAILAYYEFTELQAEEMVKFFRAEIKTRARIPAATIHKKDQP